MAEARGNFGDLSPQTLESLLDEAVNGSRQTNGQEAGYRVLLVIDTNVLISALLAGKSLPAHLMVLWREGRFDLLTSAPSCGI